MKCGTILKSWNWQYIRIPVSWLERTWGYTGIFEPWYWNKWVLMAFNLKMKAWSGGKPVTGRTTDIFGDAQISPVSTWYYRFDKSGISYGLDKEDMIGSTLWLGITEPDSETSKERNLPGFKDSIINGDILWDTYGSLDLIFDSIAEVHYDRNSEGVPAETYEGETLGPIDIKLLGFAGSYKLGKYICCK